MSISKRFVNKIFCGDCVDLMQELPERCIPLTVTSQPYDHLQDLHQPNYRRLAEELFRVTADGGIVAWDTAEAIDKRGSETGSSSEQRLLFRDVGFLLHQTLVVGYTGIRYVHSNRYEPRPRYVFILSKGRPRTINLICDKHNKTAGSQRWPVGSERPWLTPQWRSRSAIWLYPGGAKIAEDSVSRGHPALMHEQLAEDLIISFSRPGDLVFDPMAGAGTTLKMAMLNQRRYLGFEIVERYCEIAQRRLDSARLKHRQELDGYFGSSWM